MFKDHLDFEFKPWNLEDSEHGKKEIYIENKNILQKMYKLKNIYEKQRGATPQQPNSNNWNDGSFLAHLLKKS